MLKIVRMPSSRRTAAPCCIAGVVRLCEKECDARFAQDTRLTIGREIDGHAQSLEHVGGTGAAGHGAVAVLGDHDAERRRDDGRSRSTH